MDVSYFLTLPNSRVTNELQTSYQRVTVKNTIISYYYIITSYHELLLKIKFKKLLSIFFYILMVTRGNSLKGSKNHIVLNGNSLVTRQKEVLLLYRQTQLFNVTYKFTHQQAKTILQ